MTAPTCPRVLRYPAQGRRPWLLVIMLHGVGSSATSLVPLAQAWQRMLPYIAISIPDAPTPGTHGPEARQWFSVAGITEANRPQRVEQALPALDRLIANECRHHGVEPDQLVLAGFSQGTIMALEWAFRPNNRCAAVIGIAGRFARLPERLPERLPTPAPRVLLLNGADDQIFPARQARAAQAQLESLGAQVESHLLVGVGHHISDSAVVLGAHFLARLGDQGTGPDHR